MNEQTLKKKPPISKLRLVKRPFSTPHRNPQSLAKTPMKYPNLDQFIVSHKTQKITP